MALYMDVHNSLPDGTTAADAAGAHAADLQVQERHGVRYLNYWWTRGGARAFCWLKPPNPATATPFHARVDERGGKVFCLVEAPNADAAHAVHREAHGLVADEIYPVLQG